MACINQKSAQRRAMHLLANDEVRKPVLPEAVAAALCHMQHELQMSALWIRPHSARGYGGAARCPYCNGPSKCQGVYVGH